MCAELDIIMKANTVQNNIFGQTKTKMTIITKSLSYFS